jgi:hypothetical protein
MGASKAEARSEDRVGQTTDLLLKVWCVMSSSAVLPRGNPLTPLVELTGPDGVRWVGYIEAVPPVRRYRLLSQTVLPGRQMRFDSADQSRVSPTVPVGSPFLPERRLLALLAESTWLPQCQAPSPSAALVPQLHWEGLRAACRVFWARIRDTVSGVNPTALRRVLSGSRMHAVWEATARHRLRLRGT